MARGERKEPVVLIAWGIIASSFFCVAVVVGAMGDSGSVASTRPQFTAVGSVPTLSTPAPISTDDDEATTPSSNSNTLSSQDQTFLHFIRDDPKTARTFSNLSNTDLISGAHYVCREYRRGLSQDQVLNTWARAAWRHGIRSDRKILGLASFLAASVVSYCPAYAP